jgi:putative ABC transport system permease protein
MLKSYFVSGIRNLLKQRGYSIIKIAGLALGLSASMIIYLFVREDLSYDTFHPNYDRIVRLLTIDQAEGVSSKLVGVTPPPLGPAAEAELPEVILSTRLSGGGNRLDLSYEDKLLKCDAAFRTESSFFTMFNFKILDGKKEGTLDEPNSIAITETLSKRLFGEESPIGKTVKLNQNLDLHIVALVEDPPKNSHLQFDLLRSLTPAQTENNFRQFLESWQGISMNTYLLLERPLPPGALNDKLLAIAKKNNAVPFFIPITQELKDVHLRSKEILFESNASKSDMLNVYVLSTIAVLILLLAAVNFMNLVTANSASRAREVGMRKVIGAIRSQLIGQHLTETILVTLVSALLAVGIAILITPLLNSTYQRFAEASTLFQPFSILVLASLVLVVGILAGLYPAFVLSGFKPIMVLKGSFKSSATGTRLRKALVVLQFTISIALMVGTGIVYQQMQYIYTANLGYNREQVITVQLNGRIVSQATAFKTELLRNPNIVAVGTSSSRVGQQLGRTGITPEGFSNTANIITSVMVADETFIPAMGMEMKSGRNFSLDFADSLSMIVNEEMGRFLKWEEPVGRKISFQTGPNPTDLTAYTVIGVVKDFHFATIRHKLEPLFILYNKDNGAMAIKAKAEGMKETIAFIEETWKKVMPGSTFDYAFLDDQFANLYRNEQAFATMFTHFTVLAIVIAAMGLFALAAYTTEQRRQEIGIRKVMGASNGSILIKLTTEFVLLVMVAFVLATVIAWFVMNQWLQDFQYSIKIGPGIFLVAGGASILIAVLTISYQSLKAMMANPVESLRSE